MLEWTSPSFVIQKKNKTVSSIHDFQEQSKKTNRILHPLLKVYYDASLKPEGFQHTTLLDINRWCSYHIWFDKKSFKLSTLLSTHVGQVGSVYFSNGLMQFA